MGLGVLVLLAALDPNALFEKVKPSVVQVQVLSASGELLGIGSGFVASDDGLIITNHHVIAPATRLMVMFASREKREASGILVDDIEHDVAVIRVPGPTVGLSLAPAAKLNMGDDVAVIGSPFGLDFTVTVGTVAKYRPDGLPPEMRALDKYENPAAGHPIIQLNATTGQGNSGGPVFNANGEVIGIAQSNIGGNSAFSFAVPSETLLTALADAQIAELHEVAGGKSTRWINLAISAVVFLIVGVLYWRMRQPKRGSFDP